MKIPKKAKRVFEGKIFDVYQWEQELYDGSTTTFEMIKRVNSSLVIPTKDNKVIISEQVQPRLKPYYSLIGGRVEKNETPLEAAKRELAEEAQLKSTNWKKFKVYQPLSKLDWKVYVYVAKNCISTPVTNPDKGEKIKILKVDFEKFVSIVQSEKFWGGEVALDIFRMEKQQKLSTLERELLR